MADKIDISEVAKSMDFITVADMSVPINIQRVMMADYDGVERDFCIYLVQGYYQQILQENEGNLNRAGKERALVYAKWDTTKRLIDHTDGLRGLVEKTSLYILLDAENTGWHHILEYENIAELLSSILEGKEGTSEAYDWKFIVEQLIPAAERAEVNPWEFRQATINIKKIRGLIPAARELIERQKAGDIDPEEGEQILKGWLEKTADKNVTYDGLREELDEWRGKSVNRANPIKGYKIMMPDGSFMVVIPTKSDKDVSVIEQALKNRVDLSITGFDWIIENIVKQTKEYKLNELAKEDR